MTGTLGARQTGRRGNDDEGTQPTDVGQAAPDIRRQETARASTTGWWGAIREGELPSHRLPTSELVSKEDLDSRIDPRRREAKGASADAGN